MERSKVGIFGRKTSAENYGMILAMTILEDVIVSISGFKSYEESGVEWGKDLEFETFALIVFSVRLGIASLQNFDLAKRIQDSFTANLPMQEEFRNLLEYRCGEYSFAMNGTDERESMMRAGNVFATYTDNPVDLMVIMGATSRIMSRAKMASQLVHKHSRNLK